MEEEANPSYADNERAFWEALIAYEAVHVPKASYYTEMGADGHAAKIKADAWIIENRPALLKAVQEARIRIEMDAAESREAITQMNQRSAEMEAKWERLKKTPELPKPKEEKSDG